jgi:hypothetical protein
LKPAVPLDRFDRPWQHNSLKKKSRKQKQAVTDPSALGAAQLKRLNKNMVTIELTQEHYQPDKPVGLGGSVLRQSDATFGAVDQTLVDKSAANPDLS